MSLTISKFENCARWGLGGGPPTVPSVIRRVSTLDGGVFVWATPSGAAALTSNTAKAETRNGQIFCIPASSCVRSAVRLFQGSRSSRLRVNSATEDRGEPAAHLWTAPQANPKFKPMVPVATCYEPTFSPNGTLWNVGRGSLRLEIGRADHIAPPLGFVGDKLAKIGRRTRKQRAA